MSEELTKKQLKRQDYVDNTIQQLLLDLDPRHRQFERDRPPIDWDAEIIGEVRDVVWDIFDRNNVCTEEEFYPFMDGDDDEN
jgi:hypothetical protein